MPFDLQKDGHLCLTPISLMLAFSPFFDDFMYDLYVVFKLVVGVLLEKVFAN